MHTELVYASVDLELSGFDPETEEIIEVGIVLCSIQNGRFVTGETFSTLVKPNIGEVRQRIVGLTGITNKEISAAPTWAEVSTTVARLLDGVVLVGHGLDLDRKFLAKAGITNFAGVVDTLELSQIFLPTYHSYNLEGLGNYFSVNHQNVHRALGDAKATVEVLRGLIGVFNKLSLATKQAVAGIGREQGKSWPALFEAGTGEQSTIPVASSVKSGVELPVPEKSCVLSSPFAYEQIMPAAPLMQGAFPPWVLAYQEREQVFRTASQFGIEPYLGAFEYPSFQVLEELVSNSKSLSTKEALAVQKVLVWKELFNSFGLLSEINWSIVGTEVKKLFLGGFSPRIPHGMAVSDYRSVQDYKQKRQLWVGNLEDYVEWLEQKSAVATSWTSLLGSVRQAQYAEGEDLSQVMPEIESISLAVDVYFGSVMLLLRADGRKSTGSVSAESLGSYYWNKIVSGARALVGKLESVEGVLASQQSYLRQVANLKQFLDAGMSTDVAWVEYSEKNITFIRKPKDFSVFHTEFTKNCKVCVYHTFVPQGEALAMLQTRLGQTSLEVQSTLGANTIEKVNVQTILTESIHKEVVAALTTTASALVLFDSAETLRGFYDTVYAKDDSLPPALVVGLHGGVHKILRNFNSSVKGVVFAPLQALSSYTGERLQVEHVLIVDMVTTEAAHPYTTAVAEAMRVTPDELEARKKQVVLTRVLRVLDWDCVRGIRVFSSTNNTVAEDNSVEKYLKS